VRWRWWGAAGLAWTLVLAARPATPSAAELTRLDCVPSPHGALVRLHLSARIAGVVHDAPGVPTRVYVDLPPGTRVSPRALGPAAVVPPLARLRVGLGDGGAPRVVVDLTGAGSHRLLHAGSTLTLAITAAKPSPTTVTRAATDDADLDGDRAPEPAHAIVAEVARREPSEPTAVVAARLRPKIVLDPGHGGHDPGAQGFGIEKDVTLNIARRLAGLLRTRLSAHVILTRTDDATLALPARTALANGEEADLFLSIHANASEGGRLHGVETYYLNNTNDRATNRLAAMENGLDLLGPAQGRSDLRYILSDLVQVGKMEESIKLATAVQRGLVGHLREDYRGVTDLGVKQGPFYVLVGAYMPCVLVETSFLTHPAEGRRLAGEAYQQAVAEGLYRGIARFLAGSRRAQTL